ncbi:hypothetical protein E4898_07010 [Salmonella enterica subsp. enterica serovar Anatum]|uniref:Uncharacterized protein n=4 Tax=Salmonella enterica TaxID=28901 RepID=A0A3V6FIS9_SALET|nr:hypothetical protein [Salmonella enterica subsp. enterica serovar Anatum]EAA7508135.1 hypothetical protein [Salmonella enterica]EAA8414376.1 hypothetical protein [Salmonella enterica subsp. enterica]EAR0302271.1 hypothetical protein [Salmonella enterica subsp. enterica serovar Give]EBH0931502.1 hypothetical protein [Salmonella enterica subsp. enterica serovar Eko]EBH8031001.1 hypothetical protein [Salmonella bongori]ECG5310093.1 hypothetical protein [Salmonella enterica subsp. enterica ser
MFSIFYFVYNTDHKWCFLIGMKECYYFNIFHFIFYFFYYYLIQHRDRENQIYLCFNHDFPSYFKTTF